MGDDVTLTPWECRVVTLIEEGEATDGIARALGIDRWSARDLIRDLRERLGATSLPEIPARAAALGVVCVDPDDEDDDGAFLPA